MRWQYMCGFRGETVHGKIIVACFEYPLECTWHFSAILLFFPSMHPPLRSCCPPSVFVFCVS